jgi:TfoX/Sxy family transcriptional regulator of competence genes
MAYDETLAERVRDALSAVRDMAEIKMFGGLCFTVRGHMAVGVSGEDLMVRLPPEEGETALGEPGARPMDFTGRPMKGFLYVGPGGMETERQLQRWVDRSVAYASSLPPKQAKRKTKKPKQRTKTRS